jgi:hypothetical protein
MEHDLVSMHLNDAHCRVCGSVRVVSLPHQRFYLDDVWCRSCVDQLHRFAGQALQAVVSLSERGAESTVALRDAACDRAWDYAHRMMQPAYERRSRT